MAEPMQSKNSTDRPVLLVAEDEPDLLSILEDGLAIFGITVIPAKDGLEGWELFEKNMDTIEGVVTDIFMPRMNGLSMYSKIHALRPELPVIFITGYADRMPEQSTDPIPLENLVRKPFELSELVRVLASRLPGRIDPPRSRA
jgi:two-component system, cell cycle sensor histidine kinase and response regulator CckA